MSYLPPNPYASMVPTFPQQAGLGGQAPSFPGASPMGAPAGLPSGMGMPGGADPMAALQGMQGAMGGLPGAPAGGAGMGQDSFGPVQGAPGVAAGMPQQPGQPPQGQQAGVFQHQSGGFADKNTTLSGGNFWTSWKGISTIIGGTLVGATGIAMAAKGKWNPWTAWKEVLGFGEKEAEKVINALPFKGALKESGEHKTNILDKISDLVKNKKTDDVKNLQDNWLQKVEDYAEGVKKYNGVGGALSEAQQKNLDDYATNMKGLFEKATEQVKQDNGDIKDALKTATDSHNTVTSVLDSLQNKIAEAGFNKRKPVSDLVESLKGKNKAEIAEALKDKDTNVTEYVDGLKEIVSDEEPIKLLDGLKKEFTDLKTAASGDGNDVAINKFTEAFGKVDSDVLKASEPHQKAIKVTFTNQSDTLTQKALTLNADDKFTENADEITKEFGKMKTKAGEVLKDISGLNVFEADLTKFLIKKEHLSDETAKKALQDALAKLKGTQPAT